MTAPHDSFFADVRTTSHPTSQGPCDLPITYTDASLLTLVYRVDPKVVRPLVPDLFEPWEIFGRAIVLLCLFEYRKTSIGPYGEIGLGVLVRRTGTRPSLLGALRDLRKERDAGLYIINLPVTTEAACAAGRELWGYPKYVETIETSFRPEGIRVALGKEFDVTMGTGPGIGGAGLPFVLFSVNSAGRLLRTIVDVDHRVQWGGSGTVALTVTGDGPMARTLRALGLQGMTPTAAFRTDAMRSILPAGEDLGAAGGET